MKLFNAYKFGKIWAGIFLGILSAGLGACGATATVPSVPTALATVTAAPVAPLATVTPLPATNPTSLPATATATSAIVPVTPLLATVPPTATTIPTAPPPVATETAPAPADAAINNLKNLITNDLQKNYGVAPANVEFISFEAQEWPDGSLGCPQPGVVYQQVITPGYLVKVKDKSQNVEYEYHSGRGTNFIMCRKQ